MKAPTVWIRIFDATSGCTEIAYDEQVEERLKQILSKPRSERTELLELPFSEDESSFYVLNASDFVSFFVSTPNQRHRYRELELAKKAERDEWKAQHGDFDPEE